MSSVQIRAKIHHVTVYPPGPPVRAVGGLTSCWGPGLPEHHAFVTLLCFCCLLLRLAVGVSFGDAVEQIGGHGRRVELMHVAEGAPALVHP